jgi:hypothetical protein
MYISTYDKQSDLDYYIPIAVGIFGIAYKDKGGWLVDSSITSLKRKIQEIKVVWDDKQIAAIAVFSSRRGGMKCTGIAGNMQLPKNIYKPAVELLMKSIIDLDDNRYWIECSEAIEHYCKKFGGNPIPAAFVENEMNLNVTAVDYDTYHYDRYIGVDNDIKTTKCMFGFRDEETQNKVANYLSSISGIDYDQFKHTVNESTKTIRQIIYRIADLHDDYDIDELTPEMHEVLQQGLKDEDFAVRKIAQLLLEEMELIVTHKL